jgi:hypothetical protein
MLPDIEDHLQSLLSALGPRIDLLLLRDVRVDPADPDSLEPCALGTGALPRERLLDLVARHVPESVPVAVPGAGLAASLAWLGRTG